MRESKTKEEFSQVLSALLGKVLDLSEASIPPSQFRAFRKLVMDVFGEVRRSLNVQDMEQGRYGESKAVARKGSEYD